jgi:hypothetical protein
MRRGFSLAFEYYPLEWAEVRQSTPTASVPRFAMPETIPKQTNSRQVQVKKRSEFKSNSAVASFDGRGTAAGHISIALFALPYMICSQDDG